MFGQGYQGGTDVEIWLFSTPVNLKTIVAAADGTFSTTVRIPSGTSAGAHSIVSVGIGPEGEELQLEAAITVTAATLPPTATIGPITNSGTPSDASLLAFFLAIGSAVLLSAMYVGRRQHR